jgi:serine/threonine-protein kinase
MSPAQTSGDSPSAAPITRFTTVSEEELRGRRDTDDARLKQWLLAGALAVLGLAVIGGAIYFATRPPSADRLFTTVKEAADRGGGEELIPVESDLTRFLQVYPSDPRAAEMQLYAEELESYRLERRLALTSRRGGVAHGMSAVERAYQEAAQLAATNPEAALDHFEALIAVYGNATDAVPRTRENRIAEQCLDLARRQITQLRPAVEKFATEQKAALHHQLARAEKLAAIDRTAAEKIWRGIVMLYGDKRWAKELVAEAEAKLTESTIPGAADSGRDTSVSP